MNLLTLVGDIFKPAAALIEDLHTSTEEKLAAKAAMLEVEVGFLEKAIEFETKALDAKTSIITAETKSESWITRNWRPLTMLSFVAAILAYWFGLTPDTIPAYAIEDMFTLVKLGLTGYVVSRGAEKVVPGVISALKQKEKT